MAGAMRKMAVYLGLVEDDDRYEQYDEYDEHPDEPAAREHGRREARRDPHPQEHPTRTMAAVRDESRGAAVTPLPDRRGAGASPARAVRVDEYRITTIHPRTYNEAKQIGEAFRSGTPVIMNLSDMDDSDAKRLVDFAAGLIFGLRGSIERVTNKVFLLSPANVVVTAEDKARIAENGFFNQS
jgi:cell division inhibitor SepF